jgi:hypothetical protein
MQTALETITPNMGIFSRRDIQAALDSLSPWLAFRQLDELVGRLNGTQPSSRQDDAAGWPHDRRKPSDVLAAEWELVTLGALGKCGHVEYEKDDLGGKSRPDIFFRLDGSSRLEFVADILAVSDVNAHKENPIADFHGAIRRFLLKYGHSSAGINVHVDGNTEGDYRNRKVLLALPRKSELDAFVKKELGGFLLGIAGDATKDADTSYETKDVRFTIRYNSKENRYCSSNHPAYTIPCSIRRNPLANALKDKGEQLAKSGYSGVKGIIVCDDGCDSLAERSGSVAFGCEQIVEEFLRTRSRILWVLVIRVRESLHPLGLPQISLGSKLYWNKRREKSLFSDISEVLKQMLAWLPQPEVTPTNALQRLTGLRDGWGRPLGGCRMGKGTIKISARALTELLAGRVTMQAFLAKQGLDPSQFFVRQLENGNTLKNASLETAEHKDDDWVVLEYDGPDSAISPYRGRKS